MGTLKTTNIQTITGSGTLTLGTSGETVSFGSGVTGLNYPAFEAYKTSNQTLTDVILTKVQFETESFDTDNCYDNSTNYRFTPTVAGKYFVYTEVLTDAQTASNLNNQKLFIYKNGSEYKKNINEFLSNPVRQTQIVGSAIIDMNGSSDYLEVYIKLDTANGGNGVVEGTVLYQKATIFGAYRIGT